jgi:Multiubiquitin
MEEVKNVEVLIIEIVELEEHAKKHGTEAPHAKHYAFRVDKQRVVVTTPAITGTQILAAVGKTPEGFKLYQHKRGHQPIPIKPNDVVNLREPGGSASQQCRRIRRRAETALLSGATSAFRSKMKTT